LEAAKSGDAMGRGQRWLRRIAWLGLGLLLLWMLAWVSIPWVLKWQLQSRLTEKLGRSVTIGEVGFRPWSLELTVSDFTVAAAAGASAPAARADAAASGTQNAASGAAPGSAAAAASAAPAASAASGGALADAPRRPDPILHIARVHANVSASSLLHFAPIIEELNIDAPQLRIARLSEGHYDFDDILARLAPQPGTPPDDGKPARFALYNVQMRDAQMLFDDRPVGRIHRVEALSLALPFISNLPADVDVKVEPRLAFKLNGASFDSGAQATPFAQDRRGALTWKTAGLDLAPYLAYQPASLPVRVTHGTLETDLAMQFDAAVGGQPTLSIRGTFAARDLDLVSADGKKLLAWRDLRVGLRDVQPLARKVALQTVRVEGPTLNVARERDGTLNLLKIAGPAAPASAPAREARAERPAASNARAASAPPAAPAAAPGGWQASVDALELADARVVWNDAATEPDAALQLDSMTVALKQVQWPVTAPMALHVAGILRPQGDGAAAAGTFEVDGPLTDREAKLDVKLDGLTLDALAPYVGQFMASKIDGRLGAQAQIDWSDAADAKRLKVELANATLDALQVHPVAVSRERERSRQRARSADPDRAHAADYGATLKQLALSGVQLDLLERVVTLGNVKLVQPTLGLIRERDGRINVMAWLKQSDPARPAEAAARAAEPASADAPWRVLVKDLAVDAGHVTLDDAAARPDARTPVRAAFSDLKVGLHNFEWRGDRAVPPARLTLAARVGAPVARGERAGRTGLVDWNGQVGMQPLQAGGKLKVERFPVHLFEPYFGAQLPVALVRGEAGYTGGVALRESGGHYDVDAAGDLLLGDVHVNTLPDANTRAGLTTADELLSWQALTLKGLTVAIKEPARPRIEIREAALNDFYARLVVTEQGRLNLQDVAGAPVTAASAPAGPAPSASASISTSSAGGASSEPVAVAVNGPNVRTAAGGRNVATAAEPPASSSPLPVQVRVGATKLINGRVDFSDHFVKPNYSANLTELNGQLGAFSSESREMATVELRGRAAGTALLEITGQVNPTVKPLALDIHAKATDLELAPLSPYAGKYAGYAIERGKLSMDVAYKIEADGRLTASNQVVLNQLTFGEKIASPEATKLPVLLAVSLLKDRNGVIDINLPVSGSLNDPQFSVGGIIVKVILNLLVKALTAPFSLLMGGGGADDTGLVEFRPGTSVLAPSGTTAIDKVAKALNDRPQLKMTVTGASDPASERDAYVQATLDARLLAEQRREALRSGAAAPEPAASAAASAAAASAPVLTAPVSLSADERTRLLKELYKRTDIPNKPRNMFGFAKDVEPAEMEKLLKSRIVVTEDAMRELALQRGIAVRDALIAKGLPSERLFLAAPKLRVSGEEDASWTPRVQLALTSN